MELAAAGVSIALFNQASRITIFPLVSITTSFVAEEDTIEKMNIEAAQNDKAKLTEVITPKDHLHQDIENGSHKECIKAPKESMVGNNETALTQDLGKCDPNNNTNHGGCAFCSLYNTPLSMFMFICHVTKLSYIFLNSIMS